MKEYNNFAAFRYFIVPSQQISLFDTIDEKRERAVIYFLEKLKKASKISYEIENRKYLLVYNRKIEKDYYILKFSSEQYRTLFKEGEFDIEDATEPDYPFVYLIFDIKRQIILVEMNTSVFQTPLQTKNKLQKCLQTEFFLTGFDVLIKEIVDEKNFWYYVNTGKPIYSIKLILNSPNLFGGFIETSKMLSAIRKRYNNTQVSLEVHNSNNPLTGIDKENEELSEAVKYAEAGGGEWILKLADPEAKGGKTTYRSQNHIKKVTLSHINLQNENGSIEIMKTFEQIETILIEKNEDL